MCEILFQFIYPTHVKARTISNGSNAFNIVTVYFIHDMYVCEGFLFSFSLT